MESTQSFDYKEEFSDHGPGCLGVGIWGMNFNLFWGLGFGVFDAWFGVWGLGFGIEIEVWGLGLRGVGFGM